MKRIISLIISAAMIICFAGCNEKEYNQSWRIVSSFIMTEREKHGMFTVNSDKLCFVDFSTMEQSPVCDDPTCKHVSSKCSAFEKTNHPFIYNNKLYYFKMTDTYQENDNYYMDSQLWQSNINGTDEKQVAEFKKLIYNEYDRLLIYKNMLYFCLTCQPYDKDYNILEASSEFVTYNLDSGEIKNYGEVVKGYSSGSWVCGLWNDAAIFMTSKAKDNRPYMEKIQEFAEKNNLSEDEALTQFTDDFLTEYYQFNLESGTIEKLKLPDPVEITESCYFYNNGDELEYFDSDNKTHKLGLKGISNITSLGKYCVLYGENDNYIYNIEKECIYKIQGKYHVGSFAAEYDDSLIIEIISDDGLSKTYEKKSVKEIGEKI